MPSEQATAQAEVLVVDDTQANLRLYGCLLEKSGFAVRTASGGAEALREVEKKIPSLVLLDYMMPEVNGIDVLRALREGSSTRRVPVVMLTASAAPSHIDLALEEGANDYITKPVNGKVLIARVKAIIRATAASATRSRPEEDQALWDELEEAAKVQRAQLPNVPFFGEGIEVSGAVIPCGKVGGDLFDIFAADGGRYLCTLLDVAGHGTASALVASETRALLRSVLERRSPGAALFRVNQNMTPRPTEKFCCTGVVEIRGSHVTIVNAGLPPIVLLRGERVVASIWGSGAPLGMFEDSLYDEERVEVEPGDRIVLLSDGLTEPFGKIDDSQSAIARLGLLPQDSPALPSPEQLRAAMQAPSNNARAEDDRTALVVEIAPRRAVHFKVPARLEAIQVAVREAVEDAPPWVDPSALDHGLTEALTNAILHGVLGLASEGRDGDGYASYLDTAKARSQVIDEAVEMVRSQDAIRLEFQLRWPGQPCPPEFRLPAGPEPASGDLHEDLVGFGMGTRIIYSLFDEVLWDEDGLGVRLRFIRPTNENSVNLVRSRPL